jgi:hypothetical protein
MNMPVVKAADVSFPVLTNVVGCGLRTGNMKHAARVHNNVFE